MKEATYEKVTRADPSNGPRGHPGRKLFSFVDPVRRYLLAAAVYAAGAMQSHGRLHLLEDCGLECTVRLHFCWAIVFTTCPDIISCAPCYVGSPCKYTPRPRSSLVAVTYGKVAHTEV